MAKIAYTHKLEKITETKPKENQKEIKYKYEFNFFWINPMENYI